MKFIEFLRHRPKVVVTLYCVSVVIFTTDAVVSFLSSKIWWWGLLNLFCAIFSTFLGAWVVYYYKIDKGARKVEEQVEEWRRSNDERRARIYDSLKK